MDLMKGIELLRNQGYGIGDISKKTGLAWPYVRDITNLIEKGEERLISAVESGVIPISLAALWPLWGNLKSLLLVMYWVLIFKSVLKSPKHDNTT